MKHQKGEKNKDRVMILGDVIDSETVQDIIKSIYTINLVDEKMEEVLTDYERPPIHLILNSFGGSVYDGLGLIGSIELSVTPVVVTCLGSAMSMAMIILACGHHRRAHHLSTIMYHEITMGTYDKIEGIKQDVKESNRLQSLIEGILFKRTKIKKKTLEIIDEIIGAPLFSRENAKAMETKKKKEEKKDEKDDTTTK